MGTWVRGEGRLLPEWSRHPSNLGGVRLPHAPRLSVLSVVVVLSTPVGEFEQMHNTPALGRETGSTPALSDPHPPPRPETPNPPCPALVPRAASLGTATASIAWRPRPVRLPALGFPPFRFAVLVRGGSEAPCTPYAVTRKGGILLVTGGGAAGADAA